LKSFGNLSKKREPWEVVAAKLERSVDAVKMKAKRLGLNVVVDPLPPQQQMIFLKSCPVLKRS
jgi:hypothetical protein